MPGVLKPTGVASTMVLLVEGEDEVQFFNAYMQHLELRGVQVVNAEGKTKFRYKIPAVLKEHGFKDVRAYAVIRDADTDANRAFQSVQGILRDNGQPVPQQQNSFVDGPPKVGIYILPGVLESGMLEDLCMGTVSNHPVMPCVDTFLGGIRDLVQFPPPPDPDAPKQANFKFPNNMSKAKAKTFLAAQEYDLPSVGVAAAAGVWNFGHDCLAPLRNFLLQLRV